MSLKAFHIAFIGLSTVLAFGYALWEINGYASSGYLWSLVAAIVSLMTSVALVLYGVRFLRKLKHIRFI